ncbi:MAG: rhodanese-like domain-containing protein [Candidatus Eiseniibacteriota bacterium]
MAERSAPLPLPAILDVRDSTAFARGHLPGSGHLPEAEWETRRSELPARDQPVLVAAESAERAREAAARLRLLGYPEAVALEASIGDWAPALDRSAARALWRPSESLRWALERFGADLPRGRAADLASGSGRDAVWLAMQGFQIEAWDRAPESLKRARELAERFGVTLSTVECDLERDRPPLPESRYSLLTCFRFLDRDLPRRMARALMPGGLLVYETFRVGQERFGRPKRMQFLLRPGELAEAFAGLEVLHSEEPSPAGGPVTSCVVARQPDRSHGA